MEDEGQGRPGRPAASGDGERAEQHEAGRPAPADLTLTCAFEDWVDVAAGREDPRLAMLKGKIRPKGSLKTLWQTQKLFG